MKKIIIIALMSIISISVFGQVRFNNHYDSSITGSWHYKAIGNKFYKCSVSPLFGMGISSNSDVIFEGGCYVGNGILKMTMSAFDIHLSGGYHPIKMEYSYEFTLVNTKHITLCIGPSMGFSTAPSMHITIGAQSTIIIPIGNRYGIYISPGYSYKGYGAYVTIGLDILM